MKIEVTVNLDERVDRLQELCCHIRGLSDLVPEWNRMEAEAHEQEIEQILFDLIKTNGTN